MKSEDLLSGATTAFINHVRFINLMRVVAMDVNPFRGPYVRGTIT